MNSYLSLGTIPEYSILSCMNHSNLFWDHNSCHKQTIRKELRIECTCNKTSTYDKGVISSFTFIQLFNLPRCSNSTPRNLMQKENGLQVFKKRLHFFPSTMKKNNKAICKIMLFNHQTFWTKNERFQMFQDMALFRLKFSELHPSSSCLRARCLDS